MRPSGMNDMAGADSPALMIAMGQAPGADAGDSAGAPAPGPAMDPTQDCVPISSLALPDQEEQMQNPEVGDKVQFTKEGTISRIDGDQAYIDVETVNGQPVKDDDEEENEPENPAEAQADADAGGDKDLQSLTDQANSMGPLDQ